MATETSGGEEAATGLPQLDFSTFPNQIFWLVVTLIVIYLILSRVALPRIASVLAERQGTITNDIAAAEDLREKAAEAEKAYEKALADARAEAQEIAAKARADIQADLDAAIAKADAEIAARSAESEAKIAEIREGAEAAVGEVAKDTAAALISALGGKGSAATIRSAVAKRTKG
ncbi:MAG: F0F1 ATP synthase subunit B' [Pseudomonadota bacterium]